MADDADICDVTVELKNERRSGVSDIDDLDDVFADNDDATVTEGNVVLRPITYKTGDTKDSGVIHTKNNNNIKTQEGDNSGGKTKGKDGQSEEYSLQPIRNKIRERKSKEGVVKKNSKEKKLNPMDSGGIPNDLLKGGNDDQLTLKPVGNAKVHRKQNEKHKEKFVSKINVGPNKDSSNHSNRETQYERTEKSNNLEGNSDLLETIDVPLTKSKPKNIKLDHIESRPLKEPTSQPDPEYIHNKSSHTKVLKQKRNSSPGKESKAPSEQENMFKEQQRAARQERQKQRAGKRSVSFNRDASTEVVLDDPNQMTMSKKFRQFARQMSEQSSMTSSIRRKRRKRPNTCFDLALFACCCCCSPLGGIGMILSVLSDNAFKDREYDKAMKLRKGTIGVSVGGIILTMLIVIIVLATQFTKMQQT